MNVNNEYIKRIIQELTSVDFLNFKYRIIERNIVFEEFNFFEYFITSFSSVCASASSTLN